MTVSNGQNVSAEVVNPALASKTANNTLAGVQDFNNTSDANSGDRITNVQRYINEIAGSTGVAGIGDATKDTYSSMEIIADGDDRKVAIGKLDAQVKTNVTNIATNTSNITAAIPYSPDVQAISEGGSITLSTTRHRQVIKVAGNGGPVSASITPISGAILNGAMVTIIGTDDTNTVLIQNNDVQYGLILNGATLLKKYVSVTLIYDSSLERYVQIL